MLTPDGHPLLASVLDIAMRPLERFRGQTVSRAAGSVLEIGFGTGLNLRHYTSAVNHLTHPLILFVLLSGQIVVLDDHRHPWSNVQKYRLL